MYSVVHPNATGAARYPVGGYAVTTVPIPFAGSQLDEPRHDAVICTRRLGQFGGDAVIDIMRTHRMVVIGGILQQNPFFVPSDEFLREFRQRRAHRVSSSAAA